MVCWTLTKPMFTAHSPIESAKQHGVKACALASASDEAKAIREEVGMLVLIIARSRSTNTEPQARALSFERIMRSFFILRALWHLCTLSGKVS